MCVAVSWQDGAAGGSFGWRCASSKSGETVRVSFFPQFAQTCPHPHQRQKPKELFIRALALGCGQVIARGAPVDEKDKAGDSALEVARMPLLEQLQAGETALILARALCRSAETRRCSLNRRLPKARPLGLARAAWLRTETCWQGNATQKLAG